VLVLIAVQTPAVLPLPAASMVVAVPEAPQTTPVTTLWADFKHSHAGSVVCRVKEIV
jgi:hypothetical protein